MKRHISLRTAIIICLTLAFLVIIPITNITFALNNVVTETDCRMCHCFNVPDKHHLLVESGTYECLNCHQIKWNDAEQSYYTELTRDCIACHGNVVGDTHHRLVQAGTYECLDCHQAVWDNASQSYYIDLQFTCIATSSQPSNQPPIADAGIDQTVSAGQSVTFSGASSYDSDGSIIYYTWDFGDGLTGTGITATHTYDNPGLYTVILIVTDNKGNADTDTAIVTVKLSSNSKRVYADEVLWIALKNIIDPDDTGTTADITTKFIDAKSNNHFDLTKNKRNNSAKVLSMRDSIEPSILSQAVIRLQIRDLSKNSPQNIRIYAYNYNGKTIITGSYLDFYINSNGFADLDVTPLTHQMDGYGWMKFRITSTLGKIRIYKGHFILN